jgi:adenylate cyclase
MGRPRFPKNPRFCQMCFNWLTVASIRGADIELTVLFSDVRDSVGLAERLGPAAYTALIDRYYKVASNAVIMANGIADRFVGDAVLGLFIPGMTGPDHTGAALSAARAIVAGTGIPRTRGSPPASPSTAVWRSLEASARRGSSTISLRSATP